MICTVVSVVEFVLFCWSMGGNPKGVDASGPNFYGPDYLKKRIRKENTHDHGPGSPRPE